MSTPETALCMGCIYPGLRPFDAEDALLFFGRDPQTDALLRRLDDTRFLAVVGLSGSGKSPNILNAVQWAEENGMHVFRVFGNVLGYDMQKAEEQQIVLGHEIMRILRA